VLAAETDLTWPPKVTGANLVVVPKRERVQLERSIENTANMLAVFDECRRSIASPFPPVAFRPHDAGSRAWLEGKQGVQHLETWGGNHSISSPIPRDFARLCEILQDRRDGVALLAEAYAHNHALGRYRDLIRFFERAFRLTPNEFACPLVEFLHPRFGYTESEVMAWCELRDPASHADQRNTFALEPDAWPLLGRMHQAARDVLLNKRLWRDPSVARLDVWPPSAWTISPDGSAQAFPGVRFSASILPMDAFGVFLGSPRRLTHLPDEWWCPTTGITRASGSPLEVVPLPPDSDQA
jgi:hypothetical protein